jgi:hypothetical protein
MFGNYRIGKFIGVYVLRIVVSGEFQDDSLGVAEDEGSGRFLYVCVRLPCHRFLYTPPPPR